MREQGTQTGPAAAKPTLRAVPVWDAPTRLFHWALVVLVAASWATIRKGWMEAHFLSGYAVLALLLFRLVWGVIGSQTARFAGFLAPPRRAVRHLAHLFRREADTEAGHNPAGGWMVVALLLVLAVQVGTGLCANDDIVTQGPLADYAGKALSDRLSIIHKTNFRLIQAAVALHVLAVAAYALLKGQNLVRPMLTGRKNLPPWVAAPRMAGTLRAAVVLAGAAAVAAAVANLG